VYKVTQLESSVGVAVAAEVVDVGLVLTVYGGGFVNAYPVFEQEDVRDTKSAANSSLYPKGESSCILVTPKLQSEQSFAAVNGP